MGRKVAISICSFLLLLVSCNAAAQLQDVLRIADMTTANRDFIYTTNPLQYVGASYQATGNNGPNFKTLTEALPGVTMLELKRYYSAVKTDHTLVIPGVLAPLDGTYTPFNNENVGFIFPYTNQPAGTVPLYYFKLKTDNDDVFASNPVIITNIENNYATSYEAKVLLGYVYPKDYVLAACGSSCETCNFDSPVCATCPDGHQRYGNVCLRCNPLCDTCSDTDHNVCLTCAGTYLYFGLCHRCPFPCSDCDALDSSICTACPNGYEVFNGNCIKCDHSCDTCVAGNPYQCATCLQGYTKSSITGTCISCSVSNCDSCSATDNQVCIDCADGFSLSNGVCVDVTTECNGLVANSIYECSACFGNSVLLEGSCISCDSSCNTCAQGNPFQCADCVGTDIIVNGVCVPCNSPCSTCNAGDANSCASCPGTHDLVNNQCILINTDVPLCNVPCDTCDPNDQDLCTGCDTTEFFLYLGTCAARGCFDYPEWTAENALSWVIGNVVYYRGNLYEAKLAGNWESPEQNTNIWKKVLSNCTASPCQSVVSWTAEQIYLEFTTVRIGQKIYFNNWYSPAGANPATDNSGRWEYIGICKGDAADPVVNCDSTFLWKEHQIYQENEEVDLSNKRYKAKQYIDGQKPGESELWKYIGKCDTPNLEPSQDCTNLAVWANGAYQQNSVVKYGAYLYKATQYTTAVPSQSTNWKINAKCL